MARLLATGVLLLAAGAACGAPVYKYTDRNGVITYTNVRPTQQRFTVINLKCRDCSWRRSVDWSRVPLDTQSFAQEIARAARDHALPESLLRAIIHAESAFRPRAVSDMGAQGLMQLMPDTAARYGVHRPFDPADNIRGGAAYLRFLLDLFNDDLRLAAAGYNAGENAVRRHGGVPPFAETREFVRRVELLNRRYRSAVESRQANASASP